MLNDIYIVTRKEIQEIFMMRGKRGGYTSALILVALLGILLPLQTGKEWLTNPVMLLPWSWLPLFMVMGLIADSIAGERERHTLETLLSSRLTDSAILLGKMTATILYSTGIAVAGMLVGVITINVTNPTGGFKFYAPEVFLGAVLASILGSILMSGIGVQVSLNAESVRQAYQRMSIGFIILWFVPMLFIQFAPVEMRTAVFQALESIDPNLALPIAAVALLLIDAALVAIGLFRFKRMKLILQ